MSTPFRTRYFASVAAIGMMTACASNPTQVHSADLPDAGADGEYSVNLPKPGRGEARHLNMTVSEDVSLNCPIEPHFAFDEAKPLPQDQLKVKALADCLNHPKVSLYDVALIGRTDARGTTDYNDELAMERATAVKQMLVAEGVATSRLQISVRGEDGAKAKDGFHSHGFDRRVDIELIDVVRAPVESGVTPTLVP